MRYRIDITVEDTNVVVETIRSRSAIVIWVDETDNEIKNIGSVHPSDLLRMFAAVGPSLRDAFGSIGNMLKTPSHKK